MVPGFDLNEELRPPPWSRCFQIRDLRIVKNLMREIGAILESHNVNYPTVGDEFLADEMLLCARTLLRDNALERAARM